MMLKLRELRKNNGLTMKELGAEIGVAESTISQYETGKRQPDYETLLKIGEFFGVSVDYLLTGEEEKRAPTPKGERPKSKLRSIARLEDSQITPEQDKQIADYIDFLLSRKNGQ